MAHLRCRPAWFMGFRTARRGARKQLFSSYVACSLRPGQTPTRIHMHAVRQLYRIILARGTRPTESFIGPFSSSMSGEWAILRRHQVILQTQPTQQVSKQDMICFAAANACGSGCLTSG